MPMPSSGTITFAQLQTEFGGSNPISLNEYYRGGAYVPNITANNAVPTSGAISLSNFYSATALYPITIVSTWGSNFGASPVVSDAKTLTVPSGNPGTVRFDISASDGTLQYLKTGGIWTTFTNGTTLAVANGNTLEMRFFGDVFDGWSVSVKDHTTGGTIGSWDGSVSH